MLTQHLVKRLATGDLEDFIGAWNSQRRAFTQNVDIAAERIRICFKNRQHRLIHR